MSIIAYVIFYLTVFFSLYNYFAYGKTFKSNITKDVNNIPERNEYTGEHYISKDTVYDYTAANPTDEKEVIDSSDSETDTLIYVDDLDKINSLKNKEVVKKLQKTYSEKGFESEELIHQIKKIISDALHIPLNEIHLHDLNMLMAKWRSISRAKHKIKQEGLGNQYFSKVKKQENELKASEDDILVEIPGGEVQKGAYVEVDYLIQLTK